MEPSPKVPQSSSISERGIYKLIQIPYQGTSLCISKISKYLVYSTREGRVVVYDPITAHSLLDIELSTTSLWNAHISPDESMIIAGGASGNLFRVQFPSGEILNTFNGHTSEINHCVFTSDGSSIFTASDDGTVMKWDSNEGSSQTVLNHERIIYAFDLSRDEKFIASGDSSGGAKLLNLDTNQLWEMHAPNSIWCIKISPFNRFIIAGDSGGNLTIWTMTGDLMREIRHKHCDRLRSVAISDCEKYFASTGNDHLIKLWKTSDWDEEVTYNIHNDWNKTVVYDPDNKIWLSISDNRTISIVNTPSQWGAKIMSVEGSKAYFHPNLKQLLVADKQYLYVCDVLTGETINKVKVFDEVDDNGVQFLITDTGSIVISKTETVLLIDYNTLKVVKKLELEEGKILLTPEKIAVTQEKGIFILNTQDLVVDYEVSCELDDKIVSVFKEYTIVCSGTLVTTYKNQSLEHKAEVLYGIYKCKQFDNGLFYVVSNVIHAFSTSGCKEIATARFIQNPIDLNVDQTYLYSVTRSSLELYSRVALTLERQIVFHQKISHFSMTSENYTVCTTHNEVYFHKSLNETYYVLDADTQPKITLKS